MLPATWKKFLESNTTDDSVQNIVVMFEGGQEIMEGVIYQFMGLWKCFTYKWSQWRHEDSVKNVSAYIWNVDRVNIGSNAEREKFASEMLKDIIYYNWLW